MSVAIEVPSISKERYQEYIDSFWAIYDRVLYDTFTGIEAYRALDDVILKIYRYQRVFPDLYDEHQNLILSELLLWTDEEGV